MDHPGVPSDVDAVVTWVDGDDPDHRRKLEEFLGPDSRNRPSGAHPTRFCSRGEIEYCVTSLLRFAPWLRNIHIVTDGQTPPLIARLRGSRYEHRVRMVDHRTIFSGFEEHLPTFSNRAIESVLWRIPGLAEHFIYLNDDFQVIRPVAVEDFFRDGSVVLRGMWRSGKQGSWRRRIQSMLAPEWHRRRQLAAAARAGSHAAKELSARMAGFDHKYFQVPHCPHPMRRSQLARHFSLHPQQLADNVSVRLRSASQFVATSLTDHLEIGSGSAIIDNRLGTLQIKPATEPKKTLRRHASRADADPQLAFVCVQSADLAGDEALMLVFDWLERRIGSLDDLLHLDAKVRRLGTAPAT